MPNKTNNGISGARITGVFIALTMLVGCSVNPLHKITGDVMTGYAEAENTPYVLAMTDVQKACSLGESVDPLLYSFSRVTTEPAKTGTLLSVLAGICMEQQAFEQELRYLRADYQGNTKELRDAREAMQRQYGTTAERRQRAFNRMLTGFSYEPKPDAQCPELDSDQDEITFLLGLISGAQAVLNDGKAQGRAGVSRRLAAQVERASYCVSNQKWAGIPQGLRATIWVLLPDLKPAEISAGTWEVLARNRRLGVEKGLRVTAAFELMMAENVGRDETIAKVLAYLDETSDEFDVWERYQLADLAAMRIALAVSDRLWTREHGYRTPENRFGETGTGKDEGDSIDTEGLL
ncbi:hypothetical protein [Salicola sp. Rm-C-2C1-2]|uniref:hypothetical protein n=1 Tax=Salicola sp. Rm-C-2C1-2 TaxID=3141321 RepID=UPI0032E51D35